MIRSAILGIVYRKKKTQTQTRTRKKHASRRGEEERPRALASVSRAPLAVSRLLQPATRPPLSTSCPMFSALVHTQISYKTHKIYGLFEWEIEKGARP